MVEEEEELEEAGVEQVMVLKGLVVVGEEVFLPPWWSSSMADSWTCSSVVTCPLRHHCAMTMSTDKTFSSLLAAAGIKGRCGKCLPVCHRTTFWFGLSAKSQREIATLASSIMGDFGLYACIFAYTRDSVDACAAMLGYSTVDILGW